MHTVECVLESLLWDENKYFWGLDIITEEYDEMKLKGLIEIEKGELLSKYNHLWTNFSLLPTGSILALPSDNTTSLASNTTWSSRFFIQLELY